MYCKATNYMQNVLKSMDGLHHHIAQPTTAWFPHIPYKVESKMGISRGEIDDRRQQITIRFADNEHRKCRRELAGEAKRSIH